MKANKMPTILHKTTTNSEKNQSAIFGSKKARGLESKLAVRLLGSTSFKSPYNFSLPFSKQPFRCGYCFSLAVKFNVSCDLWNQCVVSIFLDRQVYFKFFVVVNMPFILIIHVIKNVDELLVHYLLLL